MAVDKLQARQERKKEKLEEKAREEQKEKASQAAPEEKKEQPKKEKKKKEIVKPEVQEAIGRAEYLPISPKHSVEICKAIKNKPIERARNILHEAIEKKKPIRLHRFNKEVAHSKGKGFGAGRFMVKASERILGVLDNAIANAAYLNLDPTKLYVKSAVSNRAVSKNKGGRYTHLAITVSEKKPKVKN